VLITLLENPYPSFGIPKKLVFIFLSSFSSWRIAIEKLPAGKPEKIKDADLLFIATRAFLNAFSGLSGNPSHSLNKLISTKPLLLWRLLTLRFIPSCAVTCFKLRTKKAKVNEKMNFCCMVKITSECQNCLVSNAVLEN
jgi:hypothetical protein